MNAVPSCVIRLALKDHQILGSVISFVPIDMVNDFALPERSPEYAFCHGPVLVPAIQFSIGVCITGIDAGQSYFFSDLWSHPIRIMVSVVIAQVRVPRDWSSLRVILF